MILDAQSVAVSRTALEVHALGALGIFAILQDSYPPCSPFISSYINCTELSSWQLNSSIVADLL